MTKRSFFKSLMGAVAAVALAPEIAFGTKLVLPKATASIHPAWETAPFESAFILMRVETSKYGIQTVTAIPEEDWEKTLAVGKWRTIPS